MEENVMAETARLMDYFYTMVPDKPGEGARILDEFRSGGVNLVAYSGFPEGRGAQLDFVPMDPAAFRAVAKLMKLKIKGPKRCFIIEGDDRIGACAEVLGKLAAAKVNVTAMDACAAGAGRWGAILWVKPGAVKKAAAVLGAM
jgi:prephenate dehydratase